MKDGRNKTGLDVIKERPALMSEFAILNRIKLDVLRKSQEEGDYQEPSTSPSKKDKRQAAGRSSTITSSVERSSTKFNIYIDAEVRDELEIRQNKE